MCLDIVHKILAILKPEEMKEILGAVNAFVSHPSPACRERMYDILMWIQDNYRFAFCSLHPLLHWLRQSSTTRNFLLVVVLSSVYFQFKFPLLFGSCSCNCVFYSDPESREDSTSVEVLNEAKETLLQGLTDENQGLQ